MTPSSSSLQSHPTRVTTRPAPSVLTVARLHRLLGVSLLVVAFATGLLTVILPDLLVGPAAMNGSARGTAWVVVLVTVPVGVVSRGLALRGSARWLLVWLGATGALLYNGFMFVYATPMNELFLLYLCMLSLAIWTVVATLLAVDVRAFGRVVAPRLPARSVAVYVWVVVALNTLAWLRPILKATVDGNPLDALSGTGLTTSPVWVQDLTFWLPLMAVAAWWLWNRRPWGVLIVGSVLATWVLESLSVAVDQWLGHAADPSSTVVSGTMAVAFALLALIGLVPLAVVLRSVARTDSR